MKQGSSSEESGPENTQAQNETEQSQVDKQVLPKPILFLRKQKYEEQ